MFNLSGSEIVFLLIIALVVLGPEKLPDAVRRFGKFYGEFKKMSSGFQTEFKNAFDEPMREMRETSDALRKAAGMDFEPTRVDGDTGKPAQDQPAPAQPIEPLPPGDAVTSAPEPVADPAPPPETLPTETAPPAGIVEAVPTATAETAAGNEPPGAPSA